MLHVARADTDLECLLFREAFVKVEPSFDPAKADRAVLNSLFAWVWRDKRPECNAIGLDFDKGLWLHGSLGRGKTLCMLALRQYMNSVFDRHPVMRDDHRLKAWFKSASELANYYSAGGQEALMPFVGNNLVIDELGREPCPASSYGTKLNVLQFVLQLRYDRRRTAVTHVTTNLALNDVVARYGDHVADRCLEMFNFVAFAGPSLR